MSQSIPTYPQVVQEKSLAQLIKNVLSTHEASNLFKSLSQEQKNKTLQAMRNMVGGV